jgi:hypothetical protein
MHEIRVYRTGGGNKVRTATIKKAGSWFGIFAWCRLWFTLRKLENKRRADYSKIAADCSPMIVRN